MSQFTRTIWKFPLTLQEYQYVDMPSGSCVLSAQRQGDDLCMWCVVDPADKARRLVRICGTGHEMAYIWCLCFDSTGRTAGVARVR